MSTNFFALPRQWLLAAAVIMLFAPAGWGASAGPPGEAPIPPGQARIWIYRDYAPYQSPAAPYVRVNGAVIGVAEPGGAFYRDVPPGAYQITVDSEGMDVNQFARVALAPGQTAYVKVESLRGWGEGDDYERNTFYTRPMSGARARIEIARNRSWLGG
jgi:hypothetical protein